MRAPGAESGSFAHRVEQADSRACIHSADAPAQIAQHPIQAICHHSMICKRALGALVRVLWRSYKDVPYDLAVQRNDQARARNLVQLPSNGDMLI
jgi:hypothetical protein